MCLLLNMCYLKCENKNLGWFVQSKNIKGKNWIKPRKLFSRLCELEIKL